MATDFGKLNFSTSFNRTSAFPLDAKSYFESKETADAAIVSAEAAGSSDTAYYFGQTVVVFESNVVTLYTIDKETVATTVDPRGYRGKLTQVGSLPVGDDVTVVVTEDATTKKSTIALKGASAAAADSVLRKKTDGTFEWATVYTKTQVDSAISSEATTRASADSALSTRIDNLEGRGRFLSTWNATTGLPETYPTPTSYPYTYTFKTGDYYIIGTVGTDTLYKPSGSSITKASESASWVVGHETETNGIAVNDMYLYDGTSWVWFKTAGEIKWGQITGTLSEQSDLNTALAGKLSNETTLAGLDLKDNITKSQLLTAINVADGATKVEDSSTNGNIKVNGSEINVYSDTDVRGLISTETTRATTAETTINTAVSKRAYQLANASSDTSITISESSSAEKTYVSVNTDVIASKEYVDDQIAEGEVDITLTKDSSNHLTKITLDSTDYNIGTIGQKDSLSASDIPSITLSKISDVTATAAELNVLDGITATTTELNYTDGVTSNIQTQLNTKIDTAGAGLTKSGTTLGHTNSVTAGTIGTTSAQTPSAGSTFNIPYATFDAQGHITGKGTSTVKIPAATVDTNQTVKAGSVTFGTNDAVDIVAGSNVTVTGDATNKKITIAATDTTYTAGAGVVISGNEISLNLEGEGSRSAKAYALENDDTGLYVNVPWTDTHYTSQNIVGASNSATANATATNGNVYLNHIENNAVTSAHNIKGTGATTVTSDASGNITINSTDTDTHYTNSLTLKGAGTTVTTFTQNSDKSLDIVAGSNVTITPDATNSKITIASSYTDTKNTAGATDTSSKIFLVGATTQGANPQTYTHDTAYVGTDGCLYSGGTKVLTAHQDISGKVDKVSSTDNAIVRFNGTTGAVQNSGVTIDDEDTLHLPYDEDEATIGCEDDKLNIEFANQVHINSQEVVLGDTTSSTNIRLYNGSSTNTVDLAPLATTTSARASKFVVTDSSGNLGYAGGFDSTGGLIINGGNASLS